MSHPAYEFETCEAALNGILNGTLTVAGINKDNLSSSGWIWEGPIYLLKKIIPRQDIIAITYKGKTGFRLLPSVLMLPIANTTTPRLPGTLRRQYGDAHP